MDINALSFYTIKTPEFSGTDYADLIKKVRKEFAVLKSKTRRKIHVRSAYFHKKKIFFDYFWAHLLEKPKGQRIERLKLFPCAIELLETSHCKPRITPNPNKKIETFYRFYGITKSGKKFVVQVKENVSSGTRQLISVFPS